MRPTRPAPNVHTAAVLARPAIAAALAGLVFVTGCQEQKYVDKQKVDATPLNIDAAMQQRQWDRVTAEYQSGATHNGSTGTLFTPNHDASPYTYAVTDPGTFLLNVAILPYTLYKQRNGVDSGGVDLPPSYTAVPPQTPSTQPIPKFFGR